MSARSGAGRRAAPFRSRLLPLLLAAAGLGGLLARPAAGQWLPVERVTFAPEPTEHGGEFLILEYDLNAPDLSPEAPAYVFLRYSTDGGATWALARPHQLRGEGHDLVTRPGRQTVIWWGSDQLGLTTEGVDLKIAVRALRMVRIPGGTFAARFHPGGAFDTSKSRVEEANLPTYHLAKHETTTGMYADYLNETGRNGRGWNRLMANPDRCGIQRGPDDRYTVTAGRENHPVNYVSWYEAQAFLDWCGLRLPTELEFQKAVRGGVHLDGDDARQRKNPKPERKFPWGDEAPEAGGLWRCNCDVADRQRTPQLTAVGSFPKFSSPYGIADLVGNVAEWTLDWYATTYHNGIDGYRMIRGGSYMDPPAGVDAIAGASQLPVKRGSITGFRAARGRAP